jgi:hypothetical protein
MTEMKGCPRGRQPKRQSSIAQTGDFHFSKAKRVDSLPIFREGFSGIFDRLQRRLRALPTDNFELFILKLVGRDKKLFEFLSDGLG